jgi:hypothetical protein
MSMRKKLVIGFFILLTIPLWFSSCSGQGGNQGTELLTDAITSLTYDGPYHFNVDLEIGMTTKRKGLMSFPVEEHITIEGDIDPDGQLAKTTTGLKVFGQRVDIENIYIGSTVYSENGAGQWISHDAEGFDTGFIGLFDNVANLVNVVTVRTESIDGIETSLVAARFDSASLLETFVHEIAQGVVDLEDLEDASDNLAQAWLGPDFLPGGNIEAHLQYWIDVESRKISKGTFVLNTVDFKTYDGQEVNFKWAVEINISEYGKELIIDAPKIDGIADG